MYTLFSRPTAPTSAWAFIISPDWCPCIQFSSQRTHSLGSSQKGLDKKPIKVFSNSLVSSGESAHLQAHRGFHVPSSLTSWHCSSCPLFSPYDPCPALGNTPYLAHHSYSLFLLPGISWPSLITFLSFCCCCLLDFSGHKIFIKIYCRDYSTINIKFRIQHEIISILSRASPALNAWQV